ncbi:flagellar basal body-associated FliL family protein [Micromonospora coxensis]|uniref:Flagellar basal body-associated protein FliL n=1 Tax=Micromonospora coxensis TaxID=356852 RepID=A0A1C5JLP5_9ACTN|nr:hypothetical protein [Micromonospora coxensis]SCG71490.1 hypothetical protein GA0070614_4845 [Micromonospora coxensis]
MSQPPANPYPSQPDNGAPHGSYPPPQQEQPGGYPAPSQPTVFPAQPGQPFGDPSGAPQKKKSNVGKIVLISLAVVLVLCLGGAAIAFFAVKDEVKEGVEAINTRVVAPDTLAGRAKSTDPALTEGAKELEAQLNKSLPDATSTAGAFYGTPAKKDLVMIAAASGLNADPEKTLEDTIAGAGQSEVKIAQMKTVDAGPLGGVAKCGDAEAANVPLGVCVWSDKGSLGMIIVYFKSGQEAAAELPAMRAAIEQKN